MVLIYTPKFVNYNMGGKEIRLVAEEKEKIRNFLKTNNYATAKDISIATGIKMPIVKGILTVLKKQD